MVTLRDFFRKLMLLHVVGFSFVSLSAVLGIAQISDSAVHIEVQRKPERPHATVKEGGTLKTRNTFRSDVDLVLVPVTVTDEMSRPVTTLEKSNFMVYEGEREQPIVYFSNEDAPISIGLVVDLSGSMANKIDEVHEAVSEFFNNANPQDDYFVVTVSDKPTFLADTTQSIETIQEKLASNPPGGYTALLDAIYLAETKLRSARYQRRAILIISDGGDNASRYTLGEIAKTVQESDAQVYAVGLFDGGVPFFRSIEEKFGKHLLTKVTDAGGGRTVAVGNIAKLPSVTAAISRELRTQYMLGYKPDRDQTESSQRGNWRKIKVKVMPARSKLQAFYKRGYVGPDE